MFQKFMEINFMNVFVWSHVIIYVYVKTQN